MPATWRSVARSRPVPASQRNWGAAAAPIATIRTWSLPRSSSSWTDVSCGGATTANILDTPQGGATPQLAAVGADAALITVTIGGNDIAYSASTIRCGDAKADERCAAKLDQARIAALGQQLEDAMVGAATAKGVLVADPYVLAEGHGPCAAEGDRWVNGAKPARSGASFHPTSKGHEEMARLVMAALKH